MWEAPRADVEVQHRERKEVAPTDPGQLTARQLAPGTTKKSSSLILAHPSCNKYAPAECSQEP